MKIFHIPAFTDNYIWCIQKNNKLAVVDPGDSKELLNLIKDNDLILEDILITHHHFDHTGGCLLYTSPSPRDRQKSRMPSSA